MAVNSVVLRGIDAFGKAGSITVYFPDTATLADMQAFVTASAVEFDDITGMKINEAVVSLALTLPALKASAVAGHSVSLGANMSFDAADTEYSHSIRIPALREELVAGDGVALGTAVGSGTTVGAWAASVIAGNGTALPSDRYSNDLEVFQGGSVTARKL